MFSLNECKCVSFFSFLLLLVHPYGNVCVLFNFRCVPFIISRHKQFLFKCIHVGNYNMQSVWLCMHVSVVDCFGRRKTPDSGRISLAALADACVYICFSFLIFFFFNSTFFSLLKCEYVIQYFSSSLKQIDWRAGKERMVVHNDILNIICSI